MVGHYLLDSWPQFYIDRWSKNATSPVSSASLAASVTKTRNPNEPIDKLNS